MPTIAEFNTVSLSGSDEHWIVEASVAPVLVLSSSQNERSHASIYNNGTGNLYLKFGGSLGMVTSGSTGVFDLKMVPGALYELPKPVWQGEMWGAWDVAGGNARVVQVGDND